MAGLKKKKDVWVLVGRPIQNHNWYLFRMIQYLKVDAASGRIMRWLKGEMRQIINLTLEDTSVLQGHS